MKRFSITVLIIIATLSVVTRATQGEEFKREQLSPRGKAAYDKLFSACIFGIGRIGYAGETSKEELALYSLLEEKQGVEALKSLVASGSYEGGLYGLLGLSLRDHTEFNRAVEIYKARKEQPEWQKTGSFECFRPSADMVTTHSGCIVTVESRDKVVTHIQSGHFDKFLSAKYQPSGW